MKDVALKIGLVFILLVVTTSINVSITLVLLLMVLGRILLERELKAFLKARKSCKEKEKQYEEANRMVEEDKVLKIALTEEYSKIENELKPFNDLLTWIEKTEELQKLGYLIATLEEITKMPEDEIAYDENYKPREEDFVILGMKLPYEKY